MLSSSMLEEKRDKIINRRNNNSATTAAAASTTNNNLAPPKHGDAAGKGGGNAGARGAGAGRWATGAGGGYRRTASHDVVSHDVVGPLGGAAAAARARFGSPEDDLRGPFSFSYEYTGTTMQDIRNGA